MVLKTIVTGAYKPTYNWGGTLYDKPFTTVKGHGPYLYTCSQFTHLFIHGAYTRKGFRKYPECVAPEHHIWCRWGNGMEWLYECGSTQPQAKHQRFDGGLKKYWKNEPHLPK